MNCPDRRSVNATGRSKTDADAIGLIGSDRSGLSLGMVHFAPRVAARVEVRPDAFIANRLFVGIATALGARMVLARLTGTRVDTNEIASRRWSLLELQGRAMRPG
jgi:hypothetical protein